MSLRLYVRRADELGIPCSSASHNSRAARVGRELRAWRARVRVRAGCFREHIHACFQRHELTQDLCRNIPWSFSMEMYRIEYCLAKSITNISSHAKKSIEKKRVFSEVQPSNPPAYHVFA